MVKSEIQKAWSVWIDEREKVITIKKSPSGKETYFKNREIGIKNVCELVLRGYKIG